MAYSIGARTTFIDNSQFPSVIRAKGISQNTFLTLYNRSSSIRAVAGSVSGLIPTVGSEQVIKNVGASSGGTGLCRLDDENAVAIFRNASTTWGSKVVYLSGVSIGTGALVGNFGGTLRDVCALSSTKIAVVYTTGFPGRIYIVIGTVDTTLKTITYGTPVLDSTSRSRTQVRVDNFNDTYGIASFNTGSGSNEQVILFSVSGTVPTLGSLINFSATPGYTVSRAIGVACLGSDRVAVLTINYDGVSEWHLRVKYFSRSGLTLTELGDYSVYDSNSVSTNCDIFANDDHSKVFIFFNNNSEPKLLMESFTVSSSALTKEENNLEIEDLTGASGTQYTAGGYFPGGDSMVLAYRYLLTNYIGAVKIVDPTGASPFTPKIMVI